jgi:voltage-gated potassium channel
MADSTGAAPDIPDEVRVPVHVIARTGLRALGTTAVLMVVYYWLPLDHTSAWVAATILIIGLAALIALVNFQVSWIARSAFPRLRAIEALATSLPLFLLLFAGTYVYLSTTSASNFGERLTHTDALYFTVTVFATVGFGDITAKSEGARLLVTGQMVLDLLILGVGARIILGAVTRGRQRQPRNAGTGQ